MNKPTRAIGGGVASRALGSLNRSLAADEFCVRRRGRARGSDVSVAAVSWTQPLKTTSN